jgi:phosphoribosylformylglycinamidine synthase
MALAGRLGLELSLVDLPRSADVARDDVALFAESSGRFLVEVTPQDAAVFERLLSSRPLARLGRVTGDGAFRVNGLAGGTIIAHSVDDLVAAWQSAEVL